MASRARVRLRQGPSVDIRFGESMEPDHRSSPCGETKKTTGSAPAEWRLPRTMTRPRGRERRALPDGLGGGIGALDTDPWGKLTPSGKAGLVDRTIRDSSRTPRLKFVTDLYRRLVRWRQTQRRMQMPVTRSAALALIPLILLAEVAAAQQPKAPAAQQPRAPAAADPKLPVIRLIATGGTIAIKIDPEKKAPVPASSGEDLMATVPDIVKMARIEVQNLSNVPSDYMDPERWSQLTRAVQETLARPEVAGVIVSHGTDTLEETAWVLDLTVGKEKPVVLIGAQRNASEPDFDGPRNLLNAARICASPEATGNAARIALNNQINAAREATKTHTSDVEPFESGDFGFLGKADNDLVVF